MSEGRRRQGRPDPAMDRRIVQMLTRPKPISLSDDELDKEHARITTATERISVEAWVRYPETPIRTPAVAVAWTDRAVLVEWETAGGGVTQAWVWASAVQRTGHSSGADE